MKSWPNSADPQRTGRSGLVWPNDGNAALSCWIANIQMITLAQWSAVRKRCAVRCTKTKQPQLGTVPLALSLPSTRKCAWACAVGFEAESGLIAPAFDHSGKASRWKYFAAIQSDWRTHEAHFFGKQTNPPNPSGRHDKDGV